MIHAFHAIERNRMLDAQTISAQRRRSELSVYVFHCIVGFIKALKHHIIDGAVLFVGM